jgi:DNA-binding NarL/FixJ family response regulator
MLLRTRATIGAVTAVESAEEAVTVCQNGCPDVILMDLDLPGMGGLDGIDGIRQACPESRVVVVTALRSPEMVARAVRSGAVGFIHKSRAAEELIAVVERAAAGGIVISPDDIFSAASYGGLDRDGRTRGDGNGYGGAVFDRLTAREVEILRVLAEGMSTAEVAEALFISPLTVQSHVKSILAKLGVHSKLEAVTYALRRGIIELPRGA